jgi:acetyl esterase/lipase
MRGWLQPALVLGGSRGLQPAAARPSCGSRPRGGLAGPLDSNERPPSSPQAYLGPHAPPFFVTHGDQDPLVPVEDARRFVQRLRSKSSNPVVYAELPGAQHAFDPFHSIRFETAVDAIEAFAAWVRSREQAQRS